MSRFARVGSVDILKQFRTSLCTFAEKASHALDEADSEIQRTTTWLKQDQQTYWKDQRRKRTEQLSQAKRALTRKQALGKSPLGGRPSYVDERKAVASAQRRFEEAQQKLAKVVRWTRQLEQEAFTHKELIQGLARAVDVEIPNARAEMDRIIAALESYMALTPPSEDLSYSDQAGRAKETAAMVRGGTQPGAEDRDEDRRSAAGSDPKKAENSEEREIP